MFIINKNNKITRRVSTPGSGPRLKIRRCRLSLIYGGWRAGGRGEEPTQLFIDLSGGQTESQSATKSFQLLSRAC